MSMPVEQEHVFRTPTCLRTPRYMLAGTVRMLGSAAPLPTNMFAFAKMLVCLQTGWYSKDIYVFDRRATVEPEKKVRLKGGPP